MSGAHEQLEHAEHASHDGSHPHASGSKIFGVTMALMGVLIALCSAVVGSERNELTRAMIEQTQAHADYTSASTKFRLIMIELGKQRARELSARDDNKAASPVRRFIELAMDYTKERTLSKNWSESFKPLVAAHFDASESYEHAELFAEIGIVMASLAVLLSSRLAWRISVVLGLVCMIQVGRTYLVTRHEVGESKTKVQHEEEAFTDLRNSHMGGDRDEMILNELDPGGKMRAEIEGNSSAPNPEPGGTGTKK